ncbi:glycosyltransferase [Enterococcus alcedinis]|uniref:Glycosyltransferase 2-like domain-containing protein n=1 Tax=Enterococcus alcedinis TaxID=1274384 RepID=A0A917N6C1_9ENTE|nr:glycosyltransferase family A protein [Enterococcus alcedinis]MBP2102100.1 glycosyltransferase involved in cell wall biosynthesis [Enterococcus alcedinis]GGI65662.1 hypothetical protein GCM10011482_13160 [Enterococcus alcedinis]
MEVLVSCMNKSKDLYNEMNIQTNAIIVNQNNDVFSFENHTINNHRCRIFNMIEKGVGLSRNNALMRAKDDILVMADDDEVFVDGYEKIILEAYEKNPKADMIVFDVRIHEGNIINNRVKKNGRVNFFNSLKYGTVTFTFRKKSILKNNIFFSLLFGGGSKYMSGEDSIFISEVLRKGLRVYSCAEVIADVYNDESSWFTGYNAQYLIHRGALFSAINQKMSIFLIIQFALRKRKLFSEYSVRQMVCLMLKGKAEFEQTIN